MKTLREVLGKGALRKTGTDSEELKPWVLIDDTEYVPVNRGICGIQLFREHDMDDEVYSFTNDEIDNAVWNDEGQVWTIPVASEEKDDGVELSFSFDDGATVWQVVEKIQGYEVIKP